MKKVYVLLPLVMLCLILCTKVEAKTITRYGSDLNLATKAEKMNFLLPSSFDTSYRATDKEYEEYAKYIESEDSKYFSNIGYIKWPSAYVDLVFSDLNLNFSTYKDAYKEDNLGTTESDVRKNLAELTKQQSSLKKYAFIPGELARIGVSYGGSTCPGQVCTGGNNWHWKPIILEDLISIQKDDANGQKVNFNYPDSSEFNHTVENGNVDEDGTYISLNKLVIDKSEYDKIMSGEQKLKLYIYQSHSPFALDYFELKSNNEYVPFYITKHGYDRNGVEVAVKGSETRYYKNFETIELDSSYIHDNAIYGFYVMTNEVIPSTLQSATDYGAEAIAFYYEFKIELEIAGEGSETNQAINANDDSDIRDNNAKIYIDDEPVNIPNKKSWSQWRIYVELDTICDIINCSYVYNEDDNSYKINYYPIKDDNNIVYSINLEESNNVFESVLKAYDEVYNFKNKVIDASPFREGNKLYVPIRFLLEGLGAQVEYFPTNGEQPEEVRIYFDTNYFVDTQINEKEIDKNTKNSGKLNLDSQQDISITQQYKIYDEKTEMNNPKFLFTNNDKINICENGNGSNCNLNITNNKISFDQNTCLNRTNFYIINTYNDYPYVSKYIINQDC